MLFLQPSDWPRSMEKCYLYMQMQQPAKHNSTKLFIFFFNNLSDIYKEALKEMTFVTFSFIHLALFHTHKVSCCFQNHYLHFHPQSDNHLHLHYHWYLHTCHHHNQYLHIHCLRHLFLHLILIFLFVILFSILIVILNSISVICERVNSMIS